LLGLTADHEGEPVRPKWAAALGCEAARRSPNARGQCVKKKQAVLSCPASGGRYSRGEAPARPIL